MVVVGSTSGRVKRRNTIKIENKIFPVTHRGRVMLVARQSHCKKKKEEEVLRSRVALLGGSSPFPHLQGAAGACNRADTLPPFPWPTLPTVRFGSSSLGSLAADGALPGGKPATLAGREERRVPSSRAGRGRGSREDPHRPYDPLCPLHGEVRSSTTVRQSPGKRRAAAEVDARRRMHGLIPGSPCLGASHHTSVPPSHGGTGTAGARLLCLRAQLGQPRRRVKCESVCV